MKILEKNIKYLCKKKGISLKIFAEEIGVSEPTIYNCFEKNNMSLVQLQKTSLFFDVTIDYLISDSEQVLEKQNKDKKLYWKKKYDDLAKKYDDERKQLLSIIENQSKH